MKVSFYHLGYRLNGLLEENNVVGVVTSENCLARSTIESVADCKSSMYEMCYENSK